MSDSWTLRVRRPDLHLADPVEFLSATMVENYNIPDMLSITGRLRDLDPALFPNVGPVLYDDQGRIRFSGVWDPTGIQRNGDGTGSLIAVSDTVLAWWRVCYPVPANPWTTAGQNAAYDQQRGSVEDRILGYVDRNLGASARDERRVIALRLPDSLHRGPVGTSQIRFDQLGTLISTLAESANLRVRIIQSFDYRDYPQLILEITDTPDVSAWARFGDASSGGPAVLDPSWNYRIGRPTATTVLAAAAGEGADRELGSLTDSAAEALWNANGTGRVEFFQDMRGTGDWPQAKLDLAQAQQDLSQSQKDYRNALTKKNVAQSAYNQASASAAANPSNSTMASNKTDAQANLTDANSDLTDAQKALTDATTARDQAVTARDAALAADTQAILDQMTQTLSDNAGASVVSAPLGVPFDIDLGGTTFPVGSICAAELDGQPVTDRLRQLTTAIQRQEGSATVQVSGVIGSPDDGLQSPTQRQLARALRRLTNLERSL